jgi:serine/threonine protein kinase
MFLIVVQYCEHGSLLHWLKSKASLAHVRTLYNFSIDAANGMSYLESLGIVHRDV